MRRLGLVFLVAIPGIAGLATAGVEEVPSQLDSARALLAADDDRSAVAWLERAQALRTAAEHLDADAPVLDLEDRQLAIELWVAASDAAARIGTVSPWAATISGRPVDLSLLEAARLSAGEPALLDGLDGAVRAEVERYRAQILEGSLPMVASITR